MKAVNTHFVELPRVLEKLVGDSGNNNTRAQAAILHVAVSTLPFFSFFGMYSQVLPEMKLTRISKPPYWTSIKAN